MTLKFKRAGLSNIGDIIKIEERVDCPLIYSPILDKEEAKKYLQESKVFLICLDNKIVGSISYEEKDKGHAHIDGLVIYPEYRNKGIGTQAVEWILNELKEYKKISLVTHPENSRALRIYEKAGFKKGQVKENYFGDGQPRVELIIESST